MARNARQASRFLDELVRDADDIDAGISLKAASHKAATGRLLLQTRALDGQLPAGLPVGKADNSDSGHCHGLAPGPSRAPGDFGVQRHQYAHQRPPRWAWRRKTISTIKCWETRRSQTPSATESMFNRMP